MKVRIIKNIKINDIEFREGTDIEVTKDIAMKLFFYKAIEVADLPTLNIENQMKPYKNFHKPFKDKKK